MKNYYKPQTTHAINLKALQYDRIVHFMIFHF
jgi:hypothetical protein